MTNISPQQQQIPLLKSINLKNKKVILRVDLNVPVDQHGNITSFARIRACLPTIKYLLDQNSAVILITHFGRPKSTDTSEEQEKFSVKFLREVLEKEFIKYLASTVNITNTPKISNKKINFKFVDKSWINGFEIEPGEVALCENVRFFSGETTNDTTLAQKMAALGDVYVLDAFATAHRAHASTTGISNYIKEKAMGFLLEKEIKSLNKIFVDPKKPVTAIVGGAKVSTKCAVLEYLITKVDYLILGGGIANTFLKASGIEIGASLYEEEMLEDAITLLKSAEKNSMQILLPIDVIIAKNLNKDAKNKDIGKMKIEKEEKIYDVGSKTIQNYCEIISKSNTVLWNGPLGVFENKNFANGTIQIAKGIANNTKCFSVVGGGDTIAALKQLHIEDKFSYISTGGGAFLEYITGKTLPAIQALI